MGTVEDPRGLSRSVALKDDVSHRLPLNVRKFHQTSLDIVSENDEILERVQAIGGHTGAEYFAAQQ
ncbi:MAG TPA: hypothetical protein VMS96_08585 [Terriglobales bacterium]|nr:hypothetical protein [Terriglobales bacterium]